MMPARCNFKPLFVALVLCASARSAPAAVTAVDVVPDLRMNTFNVQFNVDLDGNGFADVWFVRSSIPTSGLKAVAAANVRLQSVPGGDAGTYYGWPLALGSTIGPSPVSPADWYYSPLPFAYTLAGTVLVGSDLVNFGLFHDQDAYLGVEMTLPDGIHYGYIHLYVQPIGDLGFLKAYAYETTPGVPILAGATPEPGRAVLLILGLAALHLRRRRVLGSG